VVGNVKDVGISSNRFIGEGTGVLLEERGGLAPSNVKIHKNEFHKQPAEPEAVINPVEPAAVIKEKGWLRDYWVGLAIAATVAAFGIAWTYLTGA